jgi:N-acyl-D-amino-acid deacylase
MLTCDTLIIGGTIVDGTGKPAFVGDVAVSGGQIVAIGPALQRSSSSSSSPSSSPSSAAAAGEAYNAARVIDAAGRYVLPGWTDIHTHYDTQCMWDPLLTPSGPSGVTTVVMGNCGVGAAPARREGREFMMNILSVVEDIPVDVMREGVQWEVQGQEWESFPEWLDALDKLPYAVDVAAMVAHSAVRPFVLGTERCNLSDRKGGPMDHPLTQAEKQAVADCVAEAVAAGAVGFSTSRFTGHRDSAGQLAPASLADADELILIAKAVAEVGGCAIEMVNDFSSYDDIPLNQLDPTLRREHFERELAWITFVAREYGLPVNWLDGEWAVDSPPPNLCFWLRYPHVASVSVLVTQLLRGTPCAPGGARRWDHPQELPRVLGAVGRGGPTYLPPDDRPPPGVGVSLKRLPDVSPWLQFTSECQQF